MISGDDISINLWNIEDNHKYFNIINFSPPKIEDLQDIITHCEFHPNICSQFLLSSSRGYFALCDLRQNTKYDNFSLRYNTMDEEGRTNYYSEIINSVSFASFSQKEY